MKTTNPYSTLAILVASAFLGTACEGTQEGSLAQKTGAVVSCASTPDTVGFEDVNNWTSTSTSLVATGVHEQGSQALAYNGGGYARFVSAQLCSLGAVDDQLTFRLFVPTEQPNPWWWGQAQLLVHAPSLGLYDRHIGSVELTGQVQLGTFNTISFSLPSDVQEQLDQGGYSDLQLTLVLNLPHDAVGPYILDDLRCGTYDDPDGEDPVDEEDDGQSVGSFEGTLSWDSEDGDISLDEENAALGETALAVKTTGDTSWSSKQLSTIEGITPAHNRLAFLAKLPSATSGMLSVYLQAPSIGLAKTLAGSASLSGHVPNAYHAFSFAMDDALVDVLENASYDDLRIRFELVGAATGTYYFDDLSLGNLNRHLFDHEAETDDVDESEDELPPDTGGTIPSTFRQDPATKFPGKPQGPV